MSKNIHNKTGQGAPAIPEAQARVLAQTLLQQASTFHQSGQLAQAQSLYESLLRIQPRHFDGLQLFGLLACQTNRHSMAIDLISRAIAINPKLAHLYLNLGLSFQALSRLEEALASFDKAIALETNLAEAHNNRGSVLREMQKPNDALLSYDKAIAIKPEYAEAYCGRGNVLVQLEQFDGALVNYDKSIELKPNSAEPYNGRGVVLAKHQRLEDALFNYDKAIELKPDFPEAWCNRGNALFGLKQPQDALTHYDKAIAFKPYYPEAYYHRGDALRELERFDEALLSYDKAIALKPDYPEAQFSRDNVLREFEQADKAQVLTEEKTKHPFTATNTIVEGIVKSSRAYKIPIRSGFERHYANYQYAPCHFADKNIIAVDGHEVRVRNWLNEPEIVVFDNILSDAECELLIELSRSTLQPTPTFDRTNSSGKGKVSSERTSEGTGFLRGENALISAIETRIAKLLNVPVENGEALNILHYVTGAEYRPHYDFFAPEDASSAVYLKESGQRVATFILYLNDVENGGETIFPEIDFSIAPRKGSAVYFSYCDINGKLDKLSLHGGAPVTRGEKWIATKWIRQREWENRK